ncbi:Hypothetical_protein [Hexamita inflata]|uniref:Hypothetical_protein n=1 Tax=Hexamita inflata TaxID=28002 RepID=A0AA86UQ34_9EUKA|nr:Hypothetical protein HINF_LOCUS34428 [Hexamita inflata]
MNANTILTVNQLETAANKEVSFGDLINLFDLTQMFTQKQIVNSYRVLMRSVDTLKQKVVSSENRVQYLLNNCEKQQFQLWFNNQTRSSPQSKSKNLLDENNLLKLKFESMTKERDLTEQNLLQNFKRLENALEVERNLNSELQKRIDEAEGAKYFKKVNESKEKLVRNESREDNLREANCDKSQNFELDSFHFSQKNSRNNSFIFNKFENATTEQELNNLKQMNNLQQKQIDELNENKLNLEEQIQILKHELFNGKINQGIESPQIMELNNEIIRYKQDLQTQMNYINTKQTINQIIAQIQQQNSEIVESNRLELNRHKTIIKNNQTQYDKLILQIYGAEKEIDEINIDQEQIQSQLQQKSILIQQISRDVVEKQHQNSIQIANQYQKQIQQLKQDYNHKISELNEVQHQFQEYKHQYILNSCKTVQLNSIKQVINSIQAQILQIKKQVQNDLQQQPFLDIIKVVSEKLLQQISNYKELSIKNQRLQEQLNNNEINENELSSQIKQLEFKCQSKEQQIQQSIQQLNLLSQSQIEQLKDLQKQLTGKNEQIERITQQFNQNQSQISLFQQQTIQLTQNITELQTKCSQNQQKLIQTNKQQQQQETDNINQKIEQLTQQINQINLLLEQTKQQNCFMYSQNEQQQLVIQQLQQKLENSNKYQFEIQQYEIEANQMKKQFTMLVIQLEEREQYSRQMAEKLKNQHSEIITQQDIKLQLDQLIQQKKESQQIILTQKEESDRLLQSLKQLNQKLYDTQNQLEKIKTQQPELECQIEGEKIQINHEISSLQHIIKELELQIIEIQSSNDKQKQKLQDQIYNVQQQLTESIQQNDNLQIELQSQSLALSNQVSQLQFKLDSQERKMAQEKKLNELNSNEKEQLMEQVKMLQLKIQDQCQKSSQNDSQQLVMQQQLIISKQQEICNLNTDIDTIKQTKINQNLMEKLDDQASQIDTLKLQNSNDAKTIQKMKLKENELHEEIEDLKERILMAQEQNQNIVVQSNAFDNQFDSQKVKQYEAEIQQLKEDQQKHVKQIQQQLQEIETIQHSFKTQLHEKDTEIEQLKSLVEKNQQDKQSNDQMPQEVQSQEKTIYKEFVEKVDQFQSSVQEQDREIQKLEEQENNQIQQIQQLKDKLSQLQVDFQQQMEQKNATIKQLELQALESQRNNNNTDVKEYQDKIEVLEKELAQTQLQNSERSTKLHRLENAETQHKQLISKLESELSSNKEQHQLVQMSQMSKMATLDSSSAKELSYQDLADQTWKQSIRIKQLEQQIVKGFDVGSMDAQTLDAMHAQLTSQQAKLKSAVAYPQTIGEVHQFKLQFDNDLSWVQLAQQIKCDWNAKSSKQLFQTVKAMAQQLVDHLKYSQNAVVLQSAFRFKYSIVVVYVQEINFLQCYPSVDKI